MQIKKSKGVMMENSHPRMQIIRGLPGSGKTTLALTRYPHLMRLETDMYFYRRGAYRFTLDNNKQAVEWFNKTIIDFCARGFDFVLTGVFAAHTERLNHAITMAQVNGYEVWIKTLTSKYKGIHEVPEEHYNSMKESFVSDRKLRELYPSCVFPRIHFGLMGKGMTLEHRNKRK